jgi:ArsR family transcriptional regulator
MPTLLPVIDTSSGTDCCTPGAAGLAATQSADVARTFKALADPARVRLLSIVAAAPGGEACICDLTEPVGLSQPTVSHHMKLLTEAGMVTREQRGRWAYFAVAPGARALVEASADAVLGA